MRIRRIRHWLAGMTGLALAITLAATPASAADDKDGPVGADPITEPVPGGFRDWGELLATQDRLDAAADQITAARENRGDDGYSGLVADPELRRVELYWRGPVPPKVAAAVEAAQRDVPVAVRAGRFSEGELLTEADKISAARGVTGVGPIVDGSGLTVSVTGSEADGRQIPEVRGARVPVSIVPFSGGEPLYDRQHDIPQFWGGARYFNVTTGAGCSTGIPVMQSGVERILGAGHCGNVGDIAKTPPGLTIGSMVNKNAGRDTMLINANTDGKIYTGKTSSNSYLPVKGPQSSMVGNYVCTSGSFTGQHCSIKVVGVNQHAGPFFPMVKSSHTSGNVAAGKGDSGGPVINWTIAFPGPPTSTKARGTMSWGETPLGSCELSSQCYATVYYAGIIDTMNWYASQLKPITVLTS